MIIDRLAVLSAAIIAASAYGAFASPPDDTLVVGLVTDIDSLDPAVITSRNISNVSEHIFTTLYQIDDDGAVTPRLSDSVSFSDDGKAVTFHIPPGATCEDGEPLTSEDVAYSFNRVADAENKFTGNTAGFVFPSIDFQNAVADDPEHVTINIGVKSSMMLGFISEVFVHCKDSYEQMSLDEAAQKPVSSGAYKVSAWNRGSDLTLEKRQEPGSFPRIVYRIIPEASTRAAELLAGNIDIVPNVSPDQIDVIDKRNEATVQKVQGTRRIYIGFNLAPTFDSPGGMAVKKAEVRHALQYAVDVPAICEQLLASKCERATGPVNPPNDNKSLEPYPYDPAMAGNMLDVAGYPRDADGVRFEITLQGPRGRYLQDDKVLQAVGQYLTDVGVKANVELMEPTIYVQRERRQHCREIRDHQDQDAGVNLVEALPQCRDMWNRPTEGLDWRTSISVPKILFAVEDCLRLFVADKPNATILDFSSGSGTTAHAVMRLNRQDGGRRQCISVTNNEVAADEHAALRKEGLRLGDAEWEKLGICDYITKPRIAAAHHRQDARRKGHRGRLQVHR